MSTRRRQTLTYVNHHLLNVIFGTLQVIEWSLTIYRCNLANYNNLNPYISTNREAQLTTSAATGWPGELRRTSRHPLPCAQHAYNCRSLNFNSHPQTPIHHPSPSSDLPPLLVNALSPWAWPSTGPSHREDTDKKGLFEVGKSRWPLSWALFQVRAAKRPHYMPCKG